MGVTPRHHVITDAFKFDSQQTYRDTTKSESKTLRTIHNLTPLPPALRFGRSRSESIIARGNALITEHSMKLSTGFMIN